MLVAHITPTALFCSKEGAAQVRLKLGLVNDDAGHNFTFTATPQEVAYAEREAFKTELTNILSRNRSSGVVAAAAAQMPKGPVTATVTLSPSKAATPAAFPASRASTSRATSVVSDGRTPILSGRDAATDFRLRKRVLLANPELLVLHKELVMGGQITEAEFWEGREVGVFYLFLSRNVMSISSPSPNVIAVAPHPCRSSNRKPKTWPSGSTRRSSPTNGRGR